MSRSAGTTVGGGRGLTTALLSALFFGTSGTLAAALLTSGWSAGAAVTLRVGGAALVLTPFALWQLRGRWGLLRRNLPMIAVFGLLAVAGCQWFYFNAVARLSVGVALLLEYLGILVVVAWMWLRHHQRPRRLTVGGAVAALLGLVLVLDVTGSARIDIVGVLWGLAAAVGLAAYFVLSARTEDTLPPLVTAWGAMVTGAVGLGVLGATGLVPFDLRTDAVRLLGTEMPWYVAIAALVLVSTVLAYVTGIAAARALGARMASFVGLTEVLFAVLFAAVLLGQVPGGMQLAGGLLILLGVTAVRIDELGGDRPSAASGDPDPGTVIGADPVVPGSPTSPAGVPTSATGR